MVVHNEDPPSRRSPRGRPRTRLHLEMLEARAVPATFLVNTFADTQAVNFATGQDAAGKISLRSAIMAANQAPAIHTIILQAGTYNLTIAGAGEDEAATGDLDIRSSLTIQGAGPGVTVINANGLDRVIDVRLLNLVPSGPITVGLQGVTITGGVAGLANDPEGGGIRSIGTLIINNSEIVGNVARGDGGFGGVNSAQGGGIWFGLSAPSLVMTNSRIANNQALAAQEQGTPTGGGFASGGGLYARGDGESTATIALTDVVFDSNQASGGASTFNFAGSAQGGGATVQLITSTSFNRVDFLGNRAVGGSLIGPGQFGAVNAGAGIGGGYSASESPIVILDSTFLRNEAIGGDMSTPATSSSTSFVGGAAFGGAIDHRDIMSINPNILRVERTTIANNMARGGNVTFTQPWPAMNARAIGGSAFGGGIYINGNSASPAFDLLVNSTVSQNQATGGEASVPAMTSPMGDTDGSAFGGGLFVEAGDPILTNSTIVMNSVLPGTNGSAGGGGVATGDIFSPNVQLRSTIVALNLAPSAASPTADLDDANITTLGNNLIGVGTPAFVNGVNGDQVGTALARLDPRLAPLALNGGRTPTHALLADSPAIQAGSNALGLATDQRGPGFPRVTGQGTDIGAFQRQPTLPPVAALDNAPNVTTPGVTLVTFVVTYTDPDGTIDLASLGNDDILVTGPNGFAQVATFVQVLSVVGNTVTVAYSILAPSGEFVPFDNGLYTITVLANAVADNDQPQLFVAPGPIGTFVVDLAPDAPIIPELEPLPIVPIPIVKPFPIIEPLLPPEIVVPVSDLVFQIFPDEPDLFFEVEAFGEAVEEQLAEEDVFFILFSFANDARSLFRQYRPPALDPLLIYGLAYRKTGYELPGSIRGEVFTDLEGNGNLTEDLPKRENVVVFIDANENGTLDAEERWTVTDSGGKFEFLGVEAGRYPVRVLTGPRAELTFPQQPLQLIELTGTHRSATEVNFGLRDRRLRRSLPTSQGPSTRSMLDIDLSIIDVRPQSNDHIEAKGAEMGWWSLVLLVGAATWIVSSGRGCPARRDERNLSTESV